jgi:hypothetical protein
MKLDLSEIQSHLRTAQQCLELAQSINPDNLQLKNVEIELDYTKRALIRLFDNFNNKTISS